MKYFQGERYEKGLGSVDRASVLASCMTINIYVGLVHWVVGSVIHNSTVEGNG